MEKFKPNPNIVSGKIIRHGAATYKRYRDQKGVDPAGQVKVKEPAVPDLTPEAKAEARKEAEKYFDTLDPEQDAIFIVSSNEDRAIETGNEYREVAHERGFEVIKPNKPGSEISEQISEGEIRVIENLSLNIDNLLVASIFNPESAQVGWNWDKVEPELKTKWEEARKIINSDDKGSFGANFFAHSEAIKGIFPELKSAKDQFERKFQNLLRLIKFALKKVKESEYPKDIKVLAFGHENYLCYALNEYFDEEGIGNCESVDFEVTEEGVRLSYRGKEKEL